MAQNDDARPTADEAWTLLQKGNGRWARGETEGPHRSTDVRASLVDGQEPVAMVLSCSDSRVPAELVFDQGLGDLFVVRTAGQAVDDAVLGSLAFGAGPLGIPLLVVLGHSRCGAVKAAVSVASGGAAPTPSTLGSLVADIVPVCEGGGAEANADPNADVAAGVDANVRRVVAQLTASPSLAGAVCSGRLRVVGARYDLETGEVVEV
ncbi:carbonic anhydrase [Pseudonocardia phyllosphaerae]|uniref:carbonic anhydrase n=1 Tax=Pseudonocardia phyllosphaerae TaxID=3390502 RepID=UPI00397D9765